MLIDTNGTRLHVQANLTSGIAAPALVFLHYWGGSARTWSPMIAKLPRPYPTYAVDLRGWGESDKPASGYRIADLADDVQGVLASLGLSRYVLIGHSMGGKVAQLVASHRQAGLAGLVLVAPSPPVPMELPLAQRLAMTKAYDSCAAAGAVLDNVLTATPLPTALREQVIADCQRGAAEAREAWPLVGMLEDISAQVGNIDVPTLVLAGGLDRVDPVETLQRELLPRVATARLQVLDGVGHLLPLEAPVELASAIDGFVRARLAGADADAPQAVMNLQ